MGAWLAEHWFELLDAVGILGGLLFTAYTVRQDDRSRRIGNSIAISTQYQGIWMKLYEHPHLARVLSGKVDLKQAPITFEEDLLVSMLISHLSTVYRAMKEGLFVELEGLRKDVDSFFALPIPREVWERSKRFQDKSLVDFVEANFPKR